MMRRTNREWLGPLFLILPALCLVGLLAATQYSRPPSTTRAVGWFNDDFREGEFIIELDPGADIDEFNDRYGTVVKEQLPGTNQFLVGVESGERVEDKLIEVEADNEVLFSGPNFIFQHAEIRQRSQAYIDQRSQAYIDHQSPVSFYGQPQVGRLRLSQAQQLSTGAGVRVAVIDTGIDFNHPLFAGRIGGPYYDFVENDGDPREEPGGAGYGHGTFVSGLIALAAPNAMILPLRAFDRDGVGTSFNIAKAIRFAVDNGAQVINMSFGLLERDKLIDDAIGYAHNRTFQVAAVGNDNGRELHYPSTQKSKVLAVTATDVRDRRASFANFGRNVQAAAPGVELYSAFPEGRWATWSGTSFSTAMVSGEAALLLQLRPSLNRSGMCDLIISTGVNINPLNPGYSSMLGRRIDYLSAVQKALQ